MLTGLPSSRIASIDLLKGIVMVLMALDHVRDYFHHDSFVFDPTDVEATTGPIFVTRWITHFCAPGFSMMAGLSAYLWGRKRARPELSAYLLKRGLWLVFIELTVVIFGWMFDPSFHVIGFITIWSLGMSMVVLAGLVRLPIRTILAFSLLLIFGHNAFDGVHFEGSFVWSILHEQAMYHWAGHDLFVAYPIIPWIAVMALGYGLGPLYALPLARRRQTLARLGWGSLALFLLVTGLNVYGDPTPWHLYPTAGQTLMSFLNRQKYPPSLQYLLMTLSPSLLFLAYGEGLRGKAVRIISTYGQVPFFYYILHIYLIHGLAMVAAQLTGYGWQAMVMTQWVSASPALQGYGYSLGVTYLVWAAVVVALYPACAWFARYKNTHRQLGWVSYL